MVTRAEEKRLGVHEARLLEDYLSEKWICHFCSHPTSEGVTLCEACRDSRTCTRCNLVYFGRFEEDANPCEKCSQEIQ